VFSTHLIGHRVSRRTIFSTSFPFKCPPAAWSRSRSWSWPSGGSNAGRCSTAISFLGRRLPFSRGFPSSSTSCRKRAEKTISLKSAQRGTWEKRHFSSSLLRFGVDEKKGSYRGRCVALESLDPAGREFLPPLSLLSPLLSFVSADVRSGESVAGVVCPAPPGADPASPLLAPLDRAREPEWEMCRGGAHESHFCS